MVRGIVVYLCLALAVVGAAWAGNGNMLQGFGPVNSSMGGSGAGLWADEPITALMFNPALISASDGSYVSLGTEFFKDGIEIEVVLPDGTTGVTDPSNQLGILPALGWTRQAAGSRFGFGYGLIAIAGFRTDYPEDEDSIIFAPQPTGFGRIYTDHRVIKIPTAVAYKVNDKLSLGLSLNGYIAELAIAPLPYKIFDVAGGDDTNRYYPQGDGLSSSYAFSIQPGFLYRVNERVTVGGSVTTEQNFAAFEWNSTFAHPDADNFGKHRRLEFDLDGPLNATLGAGVELDAQTKIAVDVTWLKYEGVSGFGSPGGVVDRVVQPFGWNNVWAYKLGIVRRFGESQTLRLGYNYSDIPLPPRNTLTATGAPAFFQHHLSAGFTYRTTEHLNANMGAYYVPRSGNTGPFLDLDGAANGTIEESNTLTSFQFGLSWNFGGSRVEGSAQ